MPSVRCVFFASLFAWLVVTPFPAFAQLWTLGSELTSPTAEAGGNFSVGVAMSADAAVVAVGAPYESHGGWRRGALHIFRKSGADYLVEQSFPGTTDGERFGEVVKISGDGDTILVARGTSTSSARVYRRMSGAWQRTDNEVGCNDNAFARAQLAFDGSALLCAGTGLLQLRSTTSPTLESIALPGPYSSRPVQAIGIAADGNTIVAGTPETDATAPGNAPGAAFLLLRSGAGWQTKKLVASDRAFEDFFGYGASMSGDGAVVYIASRRQVSATQRGKLYAFVRGPAGWPADEVLVETRQIPNPPFARLNSLAEYMTVSGDGRFLAASTDGTRHDGSTSETFTALFDASTLTWSDTFLIPNCARYDRDAPGPAGLSADGRTLLLSSGTYCDNGAPGGAVWMFTRRDTPPPPVGLEVESVVGNTVTLRWLPPVGVPAPDGMYVVEGGVLPGQVLASMPNNRATPTHTFAAPDGAFYIRVHAIFGGVRSDASNEVRLYVNVPSVPPTPTNLLGAVNRSQVALSWLSRQTTEVTGIKLHVTGPVSGTLTLPPGEAFTFPTVPNGSYTFSVSAFNRTGESGLSNTIALDFPSTCTGPPQTPTRFTGAREPGFVSLSWDPPSSGPAATSYVLLVHRPFAAMLPLTQRSISGPVPSGLYFVQVVAVNPCGTSQPTQGLEIRVQ